MFQWEVRVHHPVLHRLLRAIIQGHSEGKTSQKNMNFDLVLEFKEMVCRNPYFSFLVIPGVATIVQLFLNITI